jgi:hypothetical protein
LYYLEENMKKTGLFAIRIIGVCAVICALLSCSARKAESASMAYNEVATGFTGVQAKSLAVDTRSTDMVPAVPPLAASEPLPGANGVNGTNDGHSAVASPERKLVRTANLALRVQNLAAGETSVRKAIADAGGYVSSAYESEGALQLELRVPRNSFDGMIERISPLGKMESRSITAEDVTLQYYDLESRLETKRVLADTFRGYLKSAKTIEDILAVETRLADLQNEIDRTGSEFRNLANLVDFATIHLTLLLPDADVPDSGPGLGDRIKSLFRGFVAFVETIITVLIGVVVFGIPLVLLAAFAWWLLFGKIGLLMKLFRMISR